MFLLNYSPKSTSFLFVLFSFLVSISYSKSVDPQVDTLLRFKSLISNNNAHVLTTWKKENSACNFTGIVCDSDGFVTEINLSQHGLNGVIPFDVICSLSSLEKISLSANILRGRVDDSIRNCTNLKVLDLGWNYFAGNVPDLSSLYKLEFLNLNKSGFSGSFPWRSLENMTSLMFLSIGDNQFDVTSSFPMEVLKLERLYWLYLTNCSVRGVIPESITNLTNLENLELSDNDLFGEIPAGIGKLSRLTQLELYNNSLSGKLPAGIGSLTNLANFDVSTNRLEGDLGVVKFLTNLKSLHLFENQFTGEIPDEIGEFKDLTGLSLYRNKLTGSLPQKIGSLSDLLYIDVSENFLTGPIPPDMCKNGKLTDLLILQNMFSGEIPESYQKCESLIRFRVNNNSLSGVVPAGIWGLPFVTVIDFSMNRFEGPITSDIGNAKSLALLTLVNNQFSGSLPDKISGASSLVLLHLASNRFSGKIPETIGDLKKLSSLYLNGNSFSGPVPNSLGSCSSLADVNLSGNSLSGEIPESLGSMQSLNSLNLSNNRISGEIPASLSSLKLSNLDLSNNNLIGTIPLSLSLNAFHFDGNPRLCSETLEHIRSCSRSPGKSVQLRVLLSCIAAVILLVVIATGCFLFLKLQQDNLDGPLKKSSWAMKSFRVLSFTERDVIEAIKSENLIGKGGSGNVYKVVLDNGEELAVKHIWTSREQKGSKSSSAMLTKRHLHMPEYEAEVATLSSVRHVNVVKLYCSITSEDSNLLVYEYLPNGSLWDRLHSCQKVMMGWKLRYAIALGAAKGLEYLHHGFDRPVIHRDVKSSNILLDEEWKPRIADFGLAKMLQATGGGADWTHIIAGTHGYIAPEYAYTYKVSEKSDVYSFGVVLMELVTGKRPTEPEYGENKDIVEWVCSKMINKERFNEVVDSNISESSWDDALKVLLISIRCTAKLPTVRPSMRMVVQMLDEVEPNKLKNIVVVE